MILMVKSEGLVLVLALLWVLVLLLVVAVGRMLVWVEGQSGWYWVWW